MPASFELGVEPGAYDFRQLFGGRYARAERQDVRIVVFASQGGNFRSPRHGRAHAGHLVGNDGHSRARTTNEQSLIDVAARDFFGNFACVIRIIHRLR